MPEPKAGEVFGGKSEEGEVEPKVEMVPKSDYESLKSNHDTLTKQLEAAKRERDEAKLSVLDPDYVAFKESKGKTADPDASADDKVELADLDKVLEKLPRSKFLEVVVSKAVEKASAANVSLTQEIRAIRGTLQNVLADNELKTTAAKYKDFWDYKDEILAKIRQDDSLSFDNAYKIAKQDRITKSEEEKVAAAKSASEKPGGTSAESASPSGFKNKAAANEDAWDKVVGKDRETL